MSKKKTITNPEDVITNVNDKTTIQFDETISTTEPTPDYTQGELLYLRYKTIVDNGINNGVLRLTFKELREIQTHIQKLENRVFGVDPNCSSCVMNLLKRFKQHYIQLYK